MAIEGGAVYNEVDFLVPAQRFNIHFSYVSQRGLPFIREFVLRLVHISPVSKTQIATYFGLSPLEADEAVSDLVQRGDLTLSQSGRLTLTQKSSNYFTDLEDSPQLSTVQQAAVALSFDLATFSCLGNSTIKDSWRGGLSLSTNSELASKSESKVELEFQNQFSEIYEARQLPGIVSRDAKEQPTLYIVNSVHKLRQFPLRLSTEFKLDPKGTTLERDDYELLRSSKHVHELSAQELTRLSKPDNTMALMKAATILGDEDSLKVFDSATNAVNPEFLEDLNRLEEHNASGRTTFLGPIYTKDNWELLQKRLAPIVTKRVNAKKDFADTRFVWIAPSDPFWGKSERVFAGLSDFFGRSSTKEHRLYSPAIYVPISDAEDIRSARQWKNELSLYETHLSGIAEGFLEGNVEMLLMEGELAVVIYHFSQPTKYPVSMPLGFVSTKKSVVKKICEVAFHYLESGSAFGKPNDCGKILDILRK